MKKILISTLISFVLLLNPVFITNLETRTIQKRNPARSLTGVGPNERTNLQHETDRFGLLLTQLQKKHEDQKVLIIELREKIRAEREKIARLVMREIFGDPLFNNRGAKIPTPQSDHPTPTDGLQNNANMPKPGLVQTQLGIEHEGFGYKENGQIEQKIDSPYDVLSNVYEATKPDPAIFKSEGIIKSYSIRWQKLSSDTTQIINELWSIIERDGISENDQLKVAVAEFNFNLTKNLAWPMHTKLFPFSRDCKGDLLMDDMVGKHAEYLIDKNYLGSVIELIKISNQLGCISAFQSAELDNALYLTIRDMSKHIEAELFKKIFPLFVNPMLLVFDENKYHYSPIRELFARYRMAILATLADSTSRLAKEGVWLKDPTIGSITRVKFSQLYATNIERVIQRDARIGTGPSPSGYEYNSELETPYGVKKLSIMQKFCRQDIMQLAPSPASVEQFFYNLASEDMLGEANESLILTALRNTPNSMPICLSIRPESIGGPGGGITCGPTGGSVPQGCIIPPHFFQSQPSAGAFGMDGEQTMRLVNATRMFKSSSFCTAYDEDPTGDGGDNVDGEIDDDLQSKLEANELDDDEPRAFCSGNVCYYDSRRQDNEISASGEFTHSNYKMSSVAWQTSANFVHNYMNTSAVTTQQAMLAFERRDDLEGIASNFFSQVIAPSVFKILEEGGVVLTQQDKARIFSYVSNAIKMGIDVLNLGGYVEENYGLSYSDPRRIGLHLGILLQDDDGMRALIVMGHEMIHQALDAIGNSVFSFHGLPPDATLSDVHHIITGRSGWGYSNGRYKMPRYDDYSTCTTSDMAMSGMGYFCSRANGSDMCDNSLVNCGDSWLENLASDDGGASQGGADWATFTNSLPDPTPDTTPSTPDSGFKCTEDGNPINLKALKFFGLWDPRPVDMQSNPGQTQQMQTQPRSTWQSIKSIFN